MKLAPFQDILAADDRERCNIILGIGGGFCFVQQKYNGVNCRIRRNGRFGLSFRTSNDKLWPMEFFGQTTLDAFHQLFDRLTPDTEIHAEIISCDPRIHLATLAGWINVNSSYCEHSHDIAFAIFDTVRDELAEPFGLRTERIQNLRDGVYNRDKILFAQTFIESKPEMLEMAYTLAVKGGQEGVVYRVNPCYHFEGDSISPHAWKRPHLRTIEGRIISAIDGEGKRTGLLGAFLVELGDGTRVRVGGGKNMSDAVLREYWTNKHKYLGAMATLQYAEKSINGTPLRPQLVSVRNYE